MFIDPVFKSNEESLGEGVLQRLGRVRWLRPQEIFADRIQFWKKNHATELFNVIEPTDIRQVIT